MQCIGKATKSDHKLQKYVEERVVQLGSSFDAGTLHGVTVRSERSNSATSDGIAGSWEAGGPSSLGAASPIYLDDNSGTSPFGPVTDASRRVFVYLIATLNAAYPDYDFSDLRSTSFTKAKSLEDVTDHVNTSLLAVQPDFGNQFLSQLWSSLDASISLTDSEIYSYVPDLDSDPFAENGSIWTFNYFFYNRKLKKIVFFTVSCVGTHGQDSEDDQDELGDMEML